MPRSNAMVLLALPATKPFGPLPSAVRQPRQLVVDFRNLGLAFGQVGIPAERGPERREQLVVIEGLFQKIDGAELHGFDRERNVSVAGDHDHWNINAEFLDAA